MKKLLIMSLFIIMAVHFFLGDAFSCGMIKRGMMRGMSHQDRIPNSGEETSHALSHEKVAMEKETKGGKGRTVTTF